MKTIQFSRLEQMSRAFLAGILIGIIGLLYGIQTYFGNQAKSKLESFADVSGVTIDSSGTDLNFPDFFSKFLNKLFENVKFTPSGELDTASSGDLDTTPELERINTNMENQLTPMIQQGIDALRAASSAQESY